MLDEIAFVKASNYRLGILKSLKEREKTPKTITDKLNISRNNISASLKELIEHNIVYCINPEVRKGKLYRLTDLGEEIAKNCFRITLIKISSFIYIRL